MGDRQGQEPHAQGLALQLFQLLHLLVLQLWVRDSLLLLMLVAHNACSPPSYSPVIKSEYTERKGKWLKISTLFYICTFKPVFNQKLRPVFLFRRSKSNDLPTQWFVKDRANYLTQIPAKSLDIKSESEVKNYVTNHREGMSELQTSCFSNILKNFYHIFQTRDCMDFSCANCMF